MGLSFFVPAFIFLTFLSSFALASPVNDTGTGVVARAGDCTAINVVDAYFTLWGYSGARGKALIIKAQIRNDAYEKVVQVIHENGVTEVASDSQQAPVRIEYQSQIGNMDQVELTDRIVGMAMSGLFKVSVTMAGDTSTCVFQVDRK